MNNKLSGWAESHVIGEIVSIPPIVKATFQKNDANVVKVDATDIESDETPNKKVEERWCEKINCNVEGIDTDESFISISSEDFLSGKKRDC